MKKIFFILILSILAFQVNAQILKPVKWSYAFKKLSETEAVVYMKATIDKGWHVYSQTVKEGGPIATSFTFATAKSYSINGKTMEPKPIVRMEKSFNMEVGFFENAVIFQQKIKLKAKGPVKVTGTVDYMTCDDHQCLPPETVEFSVLVK